MKVGILTFHRAENFGAALQVYALQQYLKSVNVQSVVVDYRCKKIEHQYDILSPWILFSRKNILLTLRQYMERIIKYRSLHRKKQAFALFRSSKLSILSPICKKKMPLDLDAFIVGSDQVWRLDLTGGVDDFYFLNFPMKKETLKIAYAASSELSSFSELRKCKSQVSYYLSDFNAISVRESSFRNEIQKYVDKDVKVCIDPTFLLKRKDYQKIAQPIPYKNYILVYHLFETEEGSLLAKRISENTGKQIIEIHAGLVKRKNDNLNNRVVLFSFSPQEMLSYILNADIVITTSFHGLALSIICQKDVWVIDKGQNERLKNILSISGLENRLIKAAEQYDAKDIIDYSKVNERLDCEIENSKMFLCNSLNLRK